VQGVVCPLLVKSAGQSRNDERQNENTGKSGAENCLLLLFFELKRKFVQETWFLEVPILLWAGNRRQGYKNNNKVIFARNFYS